MREMLSSDTVVVGVGNTILSDDGVGVHAARLLQGHPTVPAGVAVLDGGTLGLELVPYLSDASRVLFLDAVNLGEAPGALTRMTAQDLLGATGGRSAHQLGVIDLIRALALVSTKRQDIVVLGVQPANTEWGTSLSPDLEAVLPRLVDAALEQLKLWEESRDASFESDSSSIPGPNPDRTVLESSDEEGS